MSFDISNVVNRGSVRWIVVAVFLFGTIFGATGIAAAELDGTDSIDAQTTMDGNSIDSGSDSWTNVSSMPTPRDGHAVAAVDGMIYAIGGYDGSDRLSVVERYDPGSDSWTTVSSMPTPRSGHAVAVVDGMIYAIGGYDGSSVERYDPGSDSWTTVSSMPTVKTNIGAATLNGEVYVVGDGSSVERYDPGSDSWTTVSSLSTVRTKPGVAAVDGSIYAVGGRDSLFNTLSSVERYDPGSDSWTTVSSMPTPRNGHAVAVVDGMIYAIGGSDEPDHLSVVERYDPGSDSWTNVSSMPTARDTSAATTADGLYAIGGNSVGGVLSTVERFTTATEDPSVTPDGTETEFYNDTTQIDANATDLEVTVNGTNGSDVFVNYYRIANDSNSTETLESEDMILSSPTGVEANTTYPVQINDTAAYRVVVHDNGDGLNASEVGEITVTPMAASGGFFGGDSGNAPIIGIIAVVAIGLYVVKGQ